MKISLNRNQIKYIAIISMVIDHLTWSLFSTATLEGQLLHFIGRLTGPIMAIMIAEGYEHTRSLKKYALRLFLFALISWVPYSLYESGRWPTTQFGVIFTLFLGLVAIWIWDKTKLPRILKVILVIGLCLLSLYGDWPIFDVLWPLFLYVYRKDVKKKWIAFSIIAAADVLLSAMMAWMNGNPFAQAFQLGAFLVLPLFLFLYNGQPGSRHPFHKWFFYIFYPLHLLILAIIFHRI